MKRLKCLLFFCLVSVAAYGQQTLTDSLSRIRNDKGSDAAGRIKRMVEMIRDSDLEPGEKVGLYYTLLLPVVKEIGKKEVYHRQMTRAYIHINIYNDIQLDVTAAKGALDTALSHAEKCMNDTLLAEVYSRLGRWETFTGSLEKGHEYYYKAIDLYNRLGDDYQVAEILVGMANSYNQMRDYKAIEGILPELRQRSKNNASVNMRYKLNQVLGVYYHLLYEAHPDAAIYRDSTVHYMSETVEMAEKHQKELLPTTDISWSYLNLMVCYLNDFDPPMLDSVRVYMDKLERLDRSFRYEDEIREVAITVNDIKAWLLYYRGEYAAAEKKMLENIDLLDRVPDPNEVIPERSEAYSFLAMLYEQTGRMALALKYQKLFNENQAERFRQEKMYALKELNVKYEVGKKEARIEELRKQQRQARRILMLSLFALAALLLIVVLLAVTFRLRRKSLEQKLYELALIAEQHAENPEYGPQGSGRKTSEIVAGKIYTIIRSSGLESAVREQYLAQLSGQDMDKLEDIFAALSDKLTPMDMKYIVCFSIGMEIAHIATIFNVEPASVYTVRYRIRKKVGNRTSLDFLT